MLAYKENRKLDSNKLVIELPESFVGNYVEVIVLQNNQIENNNSIKKKWIESSPYYFDIDPKLTFSREEIYD